MSLGFKSEGFVQPVKIKHNKLSRQENISYAHLGKTLPNSDLYKICLVSSAPYAETAVDVL